MSDWRGRAGARRSPPPEPAPQPEPFPWTEPADQPTGVGPLSAAELGTPAPAKPDGTGEPPDGTGEPPDARTSPDANDAETAEVEPARREATAAVGVGDLTAEDPSPPVEPVAPYQPPVSLGQKLFDAVKVWLTTGNSPVKVGAIVLLVGVGLLIREASRRGIFTLTIEARLIAVAVAALILMAIGWRQRERRPIYGRSLQGAAIAVLYLTTYAAFEVYDLMPAAAAAVAVILVTVGAGVLAVTQDARILAVLGIIGGFLAPVLSYSRPDDYVVVFSFYTVLSAAIIAVAWFKVWPSLNLLGLAFNFGIAAFWLLGRYAEEDWPSVQPFIATFVLMYMVLPVLFAVREPPSIRQPWTASLVFGAPFLGLGLQYLVIGHTAYGLATSALVLLGLEAVLYVVARRLGDDVGELAEAFAALGIAFAAIAVPLWLDAYYMAVAWASQGAILLWFGCRRSRGLAIAGGGLLQIMAAAAFATHLARTLPYADGLLVILNEYFAAAALLAVTGLVSSRLLHRAASRMRLDPSLAWLALAWGTTWWLAGGLIEIAYQVPSWPLPASFIFVVASCAVAVRAAGRTDWPHLEAAGAAVVPVLGFVLLAWLLQGPYHLDRYGGAAVLAVLGLVSGWLSQRAVHRMRLAPSWCWPALVWGAGWWLAGGFLEIAYRVPTWPLPVSFVFAVVSCGVAVRMFERVQWPHLFALGLGVVPVLGFVLLAWLLQGPYHLDRYGGAAVLAVAGLASGWLFQRCSDRSGLGSPFAWLALVWGMGWWLAGGLLEIATRLPSWQLPAAFAFVVASLGAAAMAAERAGWRKLNALGVLILPTMAVVLGLSIVEVSHPFGRYGWAVWPMALVVYYRFLRIRDHMLGALLATLHAGGFWVILVLVGTEVHWQVGRVAAGVWPPVAGVGAVLLLLAGTLGIRGTSRWPFEPHQRVYVTGGVGPVLAVLAVALFVANLLLDGDPPPLWYLPVLNPLELLMAAVVAVAFLWRRAAAAAGDHAFRSLVDARWALTLAPAGVVAATMSVARTIHHWRDVPWEFVALARSTELQAALSIVWAVIALATMVIAVRLGRRPVWMAGASFMGLVVAKLFFVDLSSLGAVTRVVAFLGVGALLVVVGYFAPVVPAATAEEAGGRSEDRTLGP